MHRSITPLFLIAIVAAVVSAAPAAAQNPPGLGPLDHYRTWNLASPSVSIPFPILLRDQFFSGEFLVAGPRFFSAPAQKNQEPVHNNRVHFTWYDIFNPIPDPNRNVLVHNQFGSTPITVGPHRLLLVPTLKNEPTIPGPFPPLPVDHYKCYDVVSQPAPTPITATVTTQFGTETVQIGFVRFLCNPVEKTHLGMVTPIANPTDHLVCYELPGPALQRGIFRQDQFLFSDAVVQDSRWFCVPSLKEIPTGTEGVTWSRVRALYR